MRLHSLPCLSILAGLALAVPAQAFDDLLDAAGLLPAAMAQPQVFTYAAPLGGFARSKTPPMIEDMQLAQALAAGGKDPVTGIDFSAVEGVLSLGAPPKTITVLLGSQGSVSETPQALLSRDFADRAIGDITVYYRGEDYAVDLATARDPDPLGSGMGKAQRIVPGDEFLIRTAGWPEMESTLQQLSAPPPADGMWVDAISALKQVAGDGAQLEMASGWTMDAFSPGPTVDLSTAQGAKIKSPDVDAALVFPFALIAETRGAETAALHIAIPYPDTAMAQAAGETIAARLEGLPEGVGQPQVTVAAPRDVAGSVPVMVLSVETPAGEVAGLQALYGRWLGAIYQRSFSPLMSSL
jgi:hypothetical protein